MNDSVHPPRILIVEDEALIAAELFDRLQRRGFVPLGPVDTANAAVALVDAERPELVLMDVRLKGQRDGIDAAVEIRERFGTPVLFLTANADIATYRRAQTTAPYGYVIKPFNERELVVAIDTALTRGRAERQLRHDSLTYSTIAAAVADAVIVTDAVGRVRYLNPSAERLFGWTWADVAGKQRSDVLRLFETGVPVADDDHGLSDVRHGMIVSREGRSIPVVERRVSVTDPLGADLGMVSSLTDVRELARLRDARDRSDALSEAVFAESPIAMALVRRDGQLQRINRAFEHLCGIEVNTVPSGALSLIAPAHQREFERGLAQAAEHSAGAPMEVELVRRGRPSVLVISSFVTLPNRDNGESLLLWHCLPVDAQKRLITSTMLNPPAAGGESSSLLPFDSVLLVEDEPQMRHIIQRMLVRDGLVVHSVNNGAEALQFLRTSGLSVDLVLTDIVMPQLSGGDLARIIEVEFPSLPLVFMSGYHDDIFVRDAVETGQRHIVYKPFAHADLIRTLLRTYEGRTRRREQGTISGRAEPDAHGI